MTAAKRPNLLFVFADEHRQQAMGFMDADPVLTPNLDRFAAGSMVLPNAVSNRPVCSPYRAMLMTGKYPFANGVVTNCCSAYTRFGVFLPESERCVSDVLHDAGYSLGYLGKWHLDAPDAPDVEDWREAVWDSYTPPGPGRHGFDYWHAYGCANNHLRPHYWIGDAPEEEKTYFEQWSTEHEADVAIDYIRNRDGNKRVDGQPFGLFISINPPHMPFEQVPEEYRQIYADKSPSELLNRPNVRLESGGKRAETAVNDYFAAVTGIDRQFGRILECLEEEGLADDTIVVFTADHGEMMGSHDLMYKTWWYDESFLIPFIIRWPGRIAPGTDPLHLGVPDTMPTLLGLMGLADQTPPYVEGTDYSGIMQGQDGARPTSSFYLNAAPGQVEADARGVRTDSHTFVVHRQADGSEELILHDNQADPYQMKNIAPENPALVSELRRELAHWLEKTNDPWHTG